MTSPQITLLLIAGVGVGLFIAGWAVARNMAAEKQSALMPARIVTARAVAALVARLVSWGGIVLAVACLLLLMD